MNWIVVVHPWADVTEAAMVEADTIDEAADIGAAMLQAEWREKGSDEDIDNVFVTAWDGRVAYRTRIATERAPMQCCGGPAPGYVGCGGHWATCPEIKAEQRTGRR
jgi:hypothetical protein